MRNREMRRSTKLRISRQIRLHRRFHLQHVIEARNVVNMAMREHCDINLSEVYAKCFDVVLEFVGVVACIEEDCLAVVMNECRKAPVENSSVPLISEGVVQVQDGILLGSRRASRILREQGQ